jgi:AcrR family transcriptional regulator
VFKILLDIERCYPYNLNMFKQRKAKQRAGAGATQAQILTTALATFRRRGLEAATMREIAKAAGVALGAAYYYFPSKEAIVQAYYDQVQAEHLARVSAALAGGKHDLLERLRITFRTKLDVLQGDRKLLGTLFRYTGEPEHPLSVLGPGTRANREQSIAVFALAVGDERLPEDVRAVLPSALWALHLGILLYFIYDDSPCQERTRKFADGVLQLLVRLLSLVKSPLLKPVRGSLFTLLREARFFAEPSSPAPVSSLSFNEEV